MTRAMIVGSTDYSHQTLEDMVADMRNWTESLAEVCETLENSERQLVEDAYWARVSYDVKARLGYALAFFKTSIKELNSILTDFQDEVQGNHVTRLQSLAQTASRIDRDLGKTWHEDDSELSRDYGNANFEIVEHMYAEARGMAADLIDIGNVASRLNDFIGKKGRKTSQPAKIESVSAALDVFVDATRLNELRAIKSTNFDLSKLIRLCEELNNCYATGNYMATAMLVRAILDHVPPIFGLAKFSDIVNNYHGSKSFKESMKHLENSQRDIADHHLHVQIRRSESLPNRTQVNFSSDLDVLLAEIVRLLKSP